MKKNSKIMLILGLCIVICFLSACSQEKSVQKVDENQVRKEKIQENKEDEKISEEIYMDTSTTIIQMGPEDEPEKILCDVEMGSNYNLIGSMLGQNGYKSDHTRDTVESFAEQYKDMHLSDVIIFCDTETRSDKYSFKISSDYPLEDVIKLVHDNIYIDTNRDHPAIYTKEGNAEVTMFYQIDDTYNLIITYDGDLTESLDDETFAKKLYQLVIPVS